MGTPTYNQSQSVLNDYPRLHLDCWFCARISQALVEVLAFAAV